MTDSLIKEVVGNQAPISAGENTRMQEESQQPVDYFSGMFAYQLNLLVQFYSKQTSAILDHMLNPENQSGQTNAKRRQEQLDLIKSIKYLEFFESLLDADPSTQRAIQEQVKGTELPHLVQEAFSLDEQLNHLQSIASEKVLPELEEVLLDNEMLELARTPN